MLRTFRISRISRANRVATNHMLLKFKLIKINKMSNSAPELNNHILSAQKPLVTGDWCLGVNRPTVFPSLQKHPLNSVYSKLKHLETRNNFNKWKSAFPLLCHCFQRFFKIISIPKREYFPY